jgi:very-short-patch-repair endonuclease
VASSQRSDTGVGRNSIGIRSKSGPDDRAIAELASRQHNIVAIWQLVPLGYSTAGVQRRVEARRLHRLYGGVYAVGSPKVTQKGRWMAAVLACGPGAALSHRSAIALHGLRPGPGPRWPDVSAPRSRDGQRGLKLHRPRELPDQDRVIVDGIPVTSIRRAVLEYAAVARPLEVRLALEAADRRGEVDGAAVNWLIENSRGRRSGRALRAMLAQYAEPPMTRSELEKRFLMIVRDAEIPTPSCNVVVAGHLVDYWWPRQRLVVELDGYEFHRTRDKFDSDRREDRELRLAGIEVLRFTDPDLKHAPLRTGAEVIQMLSRGAAAASDR